jgi:enoyl-CoA hydratase/carnithine racemase
MTGRYLPAEEAKSLGLINRVVPPEDLSNETDALAREISEASSLVLGIGKQAFYDQVDMEDEKALAYGARTIALNNLAEDAQSGIRAFLDRRTPEWKNR